MQRDHSPAPTLFRQRAINNLNQAGEEIHASLNVVSAGAVTLISASILILVSIIIWGIWGRVSITVPARGIILPVEQLQEADKLLAESLNDRQEKVNNLAYLWKKKTILYNKHYLTIADLEKAKEEYTAAKEELVDTSKGSYISLARPVFSALSYSPDQVLDALVFVSHSDGKKITVGMHVYVLPNGLSAFEYGYINGVVVNVSAYPASKESVYPYIGNVNLVDEFFNSGVPFIVKVKLTKNSKTISGLSWTTKLGPAFRLDQGATVDAKIVSKDCSPWQLLTNR